MTTRHSAHRGRARLHRALVPIVALSMFAAACGDDETEDAATATDASSDTTAAASSDAGSATTAASEDAAPAEGAACGTGATKVGVIYVGSKDDFGYNQAAYEAAQAMGEAAGVEVINAENVPETVEDAVPVMEDMISQGATIIFATSYGHFQPAVEIAAAHPDVCVVHQGQFESSLDAPLDNLGTYFSSVFEPVYLAGIAAGSVTETNTLGYVYAFPIPQTLENINAFALGAQSVNPDVEVIAVATANWCDPAEQAQAAQTLLDQGADVLTQHQDCTKTVIETAEAAGAYSVGYHYDASELAPNGWLTGSEWAWTDLYTDIVTTAVAGEFVSSPYNGDYRFGYRDVDAPFVAFTPSAFGRPSPPRCRSRSPRPTTPSSPMPTATAWVTSRCSPVRSATATAPCASRRACRPTTPSSTASSASRGSWPASRAASADARRAGRAGCGGPARPACRPSLALLVPAHLVPSRPPGKLPMNDLPAPPSVPCSITVLHGVGLSPTLAADVADELAPLASGGGGTLHLPLRRGYRGDPPATDWRTLLDDVAAIVSDTGPTVLVGFSGGATLALAAAVEGVPGVVGVVAHEPLVGPLAASLHATVSASASTLADEDGADATTRVGAFLARLVGVEVWAALPHGAHAFAAAHAATVLAEVPLFVGFAPTRAALASIQVPVVVTTGSQSAPARHEAAAVLESAGVRRRTVDGAGHLAVWQRPAAFSAVVHELWTDLHLASTGDAA